MSNDAVINIIKEYVEVGIQQFAMARIPFSLSYDGPSMRLARDLPPECDLPWSEIGTEINVGCQREHMAAP